jgi:hypothetical protein
MSLWPPAAWTRKDLADIADFAFASLAVVFGAWAGLVELKDKAAPAFLAAGMAASSLAAKLLSKWAEQREKTRREAQTRSLASRAVGVILEDVRRAYFAKEAAQEKYMHRVTLFVCTEGSGKGSGAKHLEIFARAGVHKDSRCKWGVDDNHPDRCYGIAGKVWSHNTTMFKTAACDWPADGNLNQKESYAASLGMTVEEAEALNVKSRSFAGAPIVVRGQKWGVLLLDSLKEDFISDGKYHKGLLNQYTQLIGQILTEVQP